MDKRELLTLVSFGDSVAENEGPNLKRYFVTTDQWRKVFNGETDVVYGPKGSGKSAIYSLLQEQEESFSNRSITFVTAENPRGATAFQELITDPPTSEADFVRLWKLYFLTLVGEVLQKKQVNNDNASLVIGKLQASGLLPTSSTLAEKFAATFEYLRFWRRWESVEGGINVDPMTGAPAGVTGKITFGALKPEQAKAGISSVDALLGNANQALSIANRKVWLGIDRLDVAFPDNTDLETNALRALFKVYLDFQSTNQIVLKVFLRTDIWVRITAGGFREASHITRALTIRWNADLLLNLLMRRALQSDELCSYYGVERNQILSDINLQKQLFFRMFPEQVTAGKRRPGTLDWMISRISDGKGYAAPRELVQLLNYSREAQIQMMEIGNEQLTGEILISGEAIKQGLKSVSEQRLYQTLYAEYPTLKPFIQKLSGEKAEQTLSTLSRIWGVAEAEAIDTAGKLHEVGFFERRGEKDSPSFWVPFLYRDALNLVRGKAE